MQVCVGKSGWCVVQLCVSMGGCVTQLCVGKSGWVCLCRCV